MEKKQELWVARDIGGELYLYDEEPECLNGGVSVGVYYASWFYNIPSHIFPDLTWEDGSIKIELRPTITDLDAKAQEYANKVADNEEIRELIINAFKAGYNA